MKHQIFMQQTLTKQILYNKYRRCQDNHKKVYFIIHVLTNCSFKQKFLKLQIRCHKNHIKIQVFHSDVKKKFALLSKNSIVLGWIFVNLLSHVF